MENLLEYIDSYFSGSMSEEERKIFHQKIVSDKSFAREVAFYLAAEEALKEEAMKEKKEWFRQLAAQQPARNFVPKESRRIMFYRLAAAAVLVGVIFLSWYLFFQKSAAPNELADRYLKDNFPTLSIKMSPSDSMQRASQLYNDGKLSEAAVQFESLAKNETAGFDAKKYAGIVYLRLDNYDKALQYFRLLEQDSLAYANPAVFYQALTLMKRNAPGDKQQVRQLLNRVVQDGLEGKETAQQWLKKI